MKMVRLNIISAFLFLTMIVAAQDKEGVSTQIPGNINDIFRSSCLGCHGTHGRILALAKLNLSDWDKYDEAKKMQKASKICSVLDEGTMPPKAFRKSKPELIPSQSQVDQICKWAGSLKTGQNKPSSN